MSLTAALRALLRDRLSAAMDQVLTRVLQELDLALEDFDSMTRENEGDREEPLRRHMVCSAGVQFPEPQVKQEPEESCFLSEPQLPECPQVKQEPTDRGRCLSAAAEVEKFSEIQIRVLTSLNTCKDPNPCWRFNNMEPTPEKEEKSFVPQQSSASCRFSGITIPESPQVTQEPTDRGRCLQRGPANTFTSVNTCKDPPETSKQGPNRSSDTEKEKKYSDRPQEQSVNVQKSPNAFVLKKPIFPRVDSKSEKMVPLNKKKGGKRARPRTRYMCYCGKLFSKEDLEIHQTPRDGEDRLFRCPFADKPPLELDRSRKRKHYEAFNVKKSGQDVAESEEKKRDEAGS